MVFILETVEGKLDGFSTFDRTFLLEMVSSVDCENWIGPGEVIGIGDLETILGWVDTALEVDQSLGANNPIRLIFPLAGTYKEQNSEDKNQVEEDFPDIHVI